MAISSGVSEMYASTAAGSSRWSKARKASCAAESPAEGLSKFCDDSDESVQFNDWDVFLDKEGNDNAMLGLSLTFYNQSLAIVQGVLDNGLVKRYNEDHCGQLCTVRTGDVLLAVNGLRDDVNAMFNAFRQSALPRLTIRRIRRFEAIIVSSGQALGLHLHENSQIVADLHVGCVKDYNKRCESGFQILPGDAIVAVNGKPVAPQELIDLLSNLSGTSGLRLLVIREGGAVPVKSG